MEENLADCFPSWINVDVIVGYGVLNGYGGVRVVVLWYGGRVVRC